MTKCLVCKVVTLLAGLGALNWLLITYLNVDLVTKVFGPMTMAAKILYTLIGIAGAILLISLIKSCPCCSGNKCKDKTS